MKISFFLLSFVLNVALQARGFEISSTRGLAKTSLSLRSRQARLKIGDEVKTQYYYTDRLSMLRIKLPDNSLVTLGPRTVLKVEEITDSTHVVFKLLQGVLRVTIVPSEELRSRRNFFVKTETIIVKPHENDFFIFHDQATDYSSIVNMQGEAEVFYNKDLASGMVLSEEVDVEREGKERRIKELTVNSQRLPTNADELSKLVDNKKGVIVKKGQISYSLKSLESMSQPVKLSKIQYNLMFKNADILVKRDKKVRVYDQESAKTIKVPLTPAGQEAPLEGFLDRKSKSYAAKSGGFVDFETGLYIPPSEHAIYIATVDSYYDESIGSLDISTGQFKAVLGLELDNQAGFVQKRIREGAPQDLINKVSENQKQMNALLDLAIINGSKDPFKKASEQFSKYTNRELLSKNNLIFSVGFISEEMSLSNTNFSAPRSSYNSDSAKQYRLFWEQKSSKLWQPFFGLGITDYTIAANELGSLTQAGDSLSFLTAGVHYSLSPRWNTSFHFMFDQKYIFNPNNSSGSQDISQVALPKFGISLDGALVRSGRFSIENSLLATISLSKTSGDLNVGQGFGYAYELDGRYWFKRDLWGSLGGFYKAESYDIKNNGNSADISYKSSGIVFKLGYVFDSL